MPKPSKTPRKGVKKEVAQYEDVGERIRENTKKSWLADIRVQNKFKLGDTHLAFFHTGLDPDTKVMFVDGVAGTGKTYVAAFISLVLLQQKEIEKIYYVRTAVESADRSIGFLPGELDDKFAPYLIPFREKMDELVDPASVSNLLANKAVEAVPLNFWRGRTARNAVVIVDEAQNLTHKECMTILTRIGENAKVIFCGDCMQSDIGSKSGFANIYDTFSDEESEDHGIFCFRFTELHIVRSEVLKFIIKKMSERQTHFIA